MALPLKKDPDVHVALAMRSPLGVTAKQVHGSDPELRVLGEIVPQPVEFLFIHGDTSERQYTIHLALDRPDAESYVPPMTLQTPSHARLPLPLEAVQAFCRKWSVEEFALFGSVLREDFSPKSDIDVLVTFSPQAKLSLFDFVEMQEEMERLLLRKVDLVSRGGLRNPFRRHEILRTRQVVYAT
jgi:predicted nucleotidyltransferase